MTPLQAALLAERAYTDKPTFGKAAGAGRAVVWGDAVGFPGTDNVACFLADLQALGEEIPGMGVLHLGFWDAWQEVSEDVLALDGVDVLLGHSEGAALALIAAAQLCLAGKPPKAITGRIRSRRMSPRFCSRATMLSPSRPPMPARHPARQG